MTTHVGRRAYSLYERGICVRLPSPLVDALDAFARDEWCNRSVATRELLERGLKAAGRPMSAQRREP